MNFIETRNISSLFEIKPKSRKIFAELLSNRDFQSLEDNKKQAFCIEFLGLLNHQDEVKKIINILNNEDLWKKKDFIDMFDKINGIDEKIEELRREKKIQEAKKKLNRAANDDFIVDRIFKNIIQNEITKNQKNFEDFEPFIQDLHRKFEPEALIGASDNNPI